MSNNPEKVVRQHNELISGISKMDLIPLKIFELCVAAIDTFNPPKDNTIYLSKKELYSFFDAKDSNKSVRFKDSIKKLQEKSIFQIKEESKGKLQYSSIVPIPTVKWNNYEDEIIVIFNNDVMPYLIDFKEGHFTKYLLSDIGKLHSKYSIILYKWISMNYRKWEGKPYENNLVYKNPYITIQELRNYTDTEEEYKRFTNFEKWVVKDPIEEINKNTHFNVKYKKKKNGRSIEGIQFYIDSVIDEKPIYEKSLGGNNRNTRKKVENLKLLPQAFEDPYINQLIDLEILTYRQVQEIADIFVELVPRYEDLDRMYIYINGKGKESIVGKHLEHIKNYMIDVEDSKHEDILSYLEISLSQYESRLRQEKEKNVHKAY